jgi:transcriptional regulator of acetoin/glycerol metabolism
MGVFTPTQVNAIDSFEASTAPATPGIHNDPRVAPRRFGLVAIYPCDSERGPSTWPVRKSMLVGRTREADIVLADAAVSRRHARVTAVDDGLQVEDLGSSHGTFVDGTAASGGAAIVARSGAVLRVGGTLLLVSDDLAAHAGPVRRLAAAFLGLPRDVIGGPALAAVWQQAAHVASLSHPVLVLGESGSGKEAVARLIHAVRTPRGPFVALNIAAIPEGLFESELFGHVRGSFTGALADRAGAFQQASGGVLFIDEVADLRRDLQVKLLRAIDQMCVRPLGSNKDLQVSVRVVAATSQDLRKACAEDRFRLDLYYRLSGIVLEIPPLRERREDVLTLASCFLQQESPQLTLSVRAAEALALARWRGNVRELQNAIARASVRVLATGGTELLPEHLPELDAPDARREREAPLTIESVEAALADARGNASHAAKALGVSRSTLYNILKREGIAADALRPTK